MSIALYQKTHHRGSSWQPAASLTVTRPLSGGLPSMLGRAYERPEDERLSPRRRPLDAEQISALLEVAARAGRYADQSYTAWRSRDALERMQCLPFGIDTDSLRVDDN